MIFEIDPECRVTYINQVTGEKWIKWKKYKDCSEEEKQQINLGMPTKNYIIFDKDLPNKTEEEILQIHKLFKESLKNIGIFSYISDRSPKGFHVFARFDELLNYTDDEAKEIRRIYVHKLNCDESKISLNGVISLPNKPHFKTGIIYPLLEDNSDESKINQIKLINIEQAKYQVLKNQKLLQKINFDKEFINYFEKDDFFQYIKNNIIPEHTNRDMTIFPNLALAAIKSGKSLEKIKEIIEPIIQTNFPGKTYREFEGWLKKVQKGEIKDYNPIQLNIWMKSYSNDKKDIYDLTPKEVDELVFDKEEVNKQLPADRFLFVWDKDLQTLENINIQWVVENWIPRGDICFIAGKAASFKSTICVHMSYAISEEKLVFNKYKTIKSKVLYLNEENSRNIMLSMINRVKKGMEMENSHSENICFSILQNIKLDNTEDLKYLINYINTHKIEVLICDSLRRFINFDENNATEINRFFNNLKILREKCNNLTIIILHHLKKDQGQNPLDIRDMLRGSSDIVNSADSVIGIARKRGVNAIQMEHIKNRSGEELVNKLVIMETGENKDMSYFYESDKEMDKDKILSKVEECADEIIKFIKLKNMKEFARKDLEELEQKYSYNTITIALRTLRFNSMIITDESKGGKYKKHKLVDMYEEKDNQEHLDTI